MLIKQKHKVPLQQSTSAIMFSRVSKNVQNYQRQIDDLRAYAEKQGWTISKIIAEKISGSKSDDDREGIGELLTAVRKGVIKSPGCRSMPLRRKPSQTHQVFEELTNLKISLYIHQFSIETLLPDGKLNPAASMIFSITADLARQEREIHMRE